MTPQRGQKRRDVKSKLPSGSKEPGKVAKRELQMNRVKSDVLLAIRPLHLANIASREKNHEYRKYRLQDGVERLWLYETRGGTGDNHGRAAITHIASIPPDVRRTPGSVPEEPFGIGNTEFNAGLKEPKYEYPIIELYELVNPITLSEMKQSFGVSAPMGWSYLKKDMWQNRWGEDDDRHERMKRVF